jgi:hypothetical protein
MVNMLKVSPAISSYIPWSPAEPQGCNSLTKAFWAFKVEIFQLVIPTVIIYK